MPDRRGLAGVNRRQSRESYEERQEGVAAQSGWAPRGACRGGGRAAVCRGGCRRRRATTITFVSPSPAEAATLTTDSVAFGFTYNKKPKATRTLVCALSGPTPSSGACDAPVASGEGSRSGKSYSGLANGSYTFTVTLTLTDGGTATATRHFSIDVPQPRPRLLDQRRHEHDRAREPGRHGRGPELHHRRPRPLRGGGRRQPRLLGQRPARTRSGARTWTARARTRASSPAPPRPSGWRSTPATSTGPTPTRARSGGRTWTARARTRASSPAPSVPARGGGRRQPRLLGQRRHGHDRAGEPGRHGREPELHHRRPQTPWGGGRRQPRLLDQPRHGHDRAGEPGRDGRGPELHHRRLRSPSGWRSTAATSTGPTPARARSGGRTWTARAPTRASSPAPRSPRGGGRRRLDDATPRGPRPTEGPLRRAFRLFRPVPREPSRRTASSRAARKQSRRSNRIEPPVRRASWKRRSITSRLGPATSAFACQEHSGDSEAE